MITAQQALADERAAALREWLAAGGWGYFALEMKMTGQLTDQQMSAAEFDNLAQAKLWDSVEAALAGRRAVQAAAAAAAKG